MPDKLWLPVSHRYVLPTPELREFNRSGAEIMNPHKRPKLELLRLFEMQALVEAGISVPGDLKETIEAELPESSNEAVDAKLVSPEGLVLGYQRGGRGSKRYVTFQLEPNEYLIDERETLLKIIRRETKTLELPTIFDEHNMEVVVGRVIPGSGMQHDDIYKALDKTTPTSAALQELKIL